MWHFHAIKVIISYAYVCCLQGDDCTLHRSRTHIFIVGRQSCPGARQCGKVHYSVKQWCERMALGKAWRRYHSARVVGEVNMPSALGMSQNVIHAVVGNICPIEHETYAVLHEFCVSAPLWLCSVILFDVMCTLRDVLEQLWTYFHLGDWKLFSQLETTGDWAIVTLSPFIVVKSTSDKVNILWCVEKAHNH